MFNFRPQELTKVETTGNQLRGIHCPSPRSGHRIVVTGGNVYSFGGYNPISVDDAVEHILFKELWVFNIVSKTWKHLKTSGNAPEELASHCAAFIDNHLLIFGGTAYPFGAKSSNDAHICNLKTLQWSKLETTGTPPKKQYGQAMAIFENKMYVVGGTSGYAYSNEVHCLNLATKEWRQLNKCVGPSHLRSEYEPEPRYRHEIAIEDNKLFVFGGGTAAESFELSRLPVFNLDTNTWFQIATTGDCPEPRRCHSCVQIKSDVYICGGLDAVHNYSCLYKINLKTLVWEKLKISLPYPLYFHAAASSESNQLFIFGGVNGHENQRTNDMFSLFLNIPSLETIAWQAVLHYAPYLALTEKQKLFELGIPISFLNEIEFVPPTKMVSNGEMSKGDEEVMIVLSEGDEDDDEWEDL
ncbi:kelch domain-containing protein 10 [Parasteatoda tepidariorum]|uniref:kelch domain-containing protein 10 n=1 Tax=Parasteatoda tepidariorum TaxID=114398 RepID=UPI001C719049|nr:kelch domain-containing protein 10 [Parasteatoda tepidariorum]